MLISISHVFGRLIHLCYLLSLVMLYVNSISKKLQSNPHLLFYMILVIRSQNISKSRVIDPPKCGLCTLYNRIVDNRHFLKCNFLTDPLTCTDTHSLYFVNCYTHITHATSSIVNVFNVSSINSNFMFIVYLSNRIVRNLKQYFTTYDQVGMFRIFLTIL